MHTCLHIQPLIKPCSIIPYWLLNVCNTWGKLSDGCLSKKQKSTIFRNLEIRWWRGTGVIVLSKCIQLRCSTPAKLLSVPSYDWALARLKHKNIFFLFVTCIQKYCGVTLIHQFLAQKWYKYREITKIHKFAMSWMECQLIISSLMSELAYELSRWWIVIEIHDIFIR